MRRLGEAPVGGKSPFVMWIDDKNREGGGAGVDLPRRSGASGESGGVGMGRQMFRVRTFPGRDQTATRDARRGSGPRPAVRLRGWHVSRTSGAGN